MCRGNCLPLWRARSRQWTKSHNIWPTVLSAHGQTLKPNLNNWPGISPKLLSIQSRYINRSHRLSDTISDIVILTLMNWFENTKVEKSENTRIKIRNWQQWVKSMEEELATTQEGLRTWDYTDKRGNRTAHHKIITKNCLYIIRLQVRTGKMQKVNPNPSVFVTKGDNSDVARLSARLRQDGLASHR